jgi:hypothetical protein
VANIYKNEMFALANTGTNLLYSVPADTRAIVKTLQTTNLGANTVVTLIANNTTTSYNAAIENVVANTAVNLLKGPLILEESQTLSIHAKDANVISGILSVLEINRNEQ